MHKVIAAILAVSSLAACVNLAPNYRRPDAPIPSAWTQSNTGNTGTANPTDIDWRTFIIDVRLREVIEITVRNNRDLRIAALNIERARTQYRIERAALFPSIGTSASVLRQRSATNDGSSTSPSTQYNIELGFSNYEIDFFGRVRNLSEAALETFFASRENQRSAQISLVAEVAAIWLTLAADMDRLKLAQDTLKNQQDAYELIHRVYELGGGSGLTVAQAQTTVDAARIDVARFTSQVMLDRNALNLLAGTALDQDLLPSTGLETASLLVEMPENMPSEVLQRRPDVLAAEYVLRASNANIGAARAAFFPNIFLTVAAGIISPSLAGLFGGGSGVWSLAPQVTQSIFDGGRNQAILDATRIQRDINIAAYERTIQIAFREVADALAQRSTLSEQIGAQQSLTAATSRIFNLSNALFRTGAANYLQVLDAQRSLYAAQQSAITLRLAEHTNRITLYKVLGGGWNPA